MPHNTTTSYGCFQRLPDFLCFFTRCSVFILPKVIYLLLETAYLKSTSTKHGLKSQNLNFHSKSTWSLYSVSCSSTLTSNSSSHFENSSVSTLIAGKSCFRNACCSSRASVRVAVRTDLQRCSVSMRTALSFCSQSFSTSAALSLAFQQLSRRLWKRTGKL